MITDQVVAALAAEGYSRDSIRTAMDALVEQDWRDEDEDWTGSDVVALRRRLGSPVADPPEPDLAAGPSDMRVDTLDRRYEPDLWSADIAHVLDRTTGGDVPLSPEQIRRVADHLLHRTSGLWDQRTHRPRATDGSFVPDYTVDRWADAIEEALQAATDGRIEVSRVELQVAANLLLHAQEDDWVPQASLLRAEHERLSDATP